MSFAFSLQLARDSDSDSVFLPPPAPVLLPKARHGIVTSSAAVFLRHSLSSVSPPSSSFFLRRSVCSVQFVFVQFLLPPPSSSSFVQFSSAALLLRSVPSSLNSVFVFVIVVRNLLFPCFMYIQIDDLLYD